MSVAMTATTVAHRFMQIAPKEDELRAFQAYDGTYDELSPPEQFLYTMASVPRLNDKINVLILMHQFEVSTQASTQCGTASVTLHLSSSTQLMLRRHIQSFSPGVS